MNGKHVSRGNRWPSPPSCSFDVRPTLRIRQREGYFDPIDACEIRCSKEIQENL
jgi:hypothetical protein